MKHAQFTGKVKTASASDSHPFQQKLLFIFTDFLPNKNKQGVPQDEAANVIATAISQPVKINYKSKKVGGHLGAIPIGPITSAYVQGEEIIAEAVVWKNEHPDVATYLEKASAEQGGVGFSWELHYAESSVDDNQVSWLHGIVVDGITIVDNPAYGMRTPLLALAEEQFHMDELQKKVEELTAQLKTFAESTAEKDKVITDLQSSVAELQKEKETLSSEVTALRTFKADAEAAKALAETVAARKTAMSEAGIDIDDALFATKQEFYLSMSDTIFTQYVSDLVAVAKLHKTDASAKDRVIIPDPSIQNTQNEVNVGDLVKALRSHRGK